MANVILRLLRRKVSVADPAASEAQVWQRTIEPSFSEFRAAAEAGMAGVFHGTTSECVDKYGLVLPWIFQIRDVYGGTVLLIIVGYDDISIHKTPYSNTLGRHTGYERIASCGKTTFALQNTISQVCRTYFF